MTRRETPYWRQTEEHWLWRSSGPDVSFSPLEPKEQINVESATPLAVGDEVWLFQQMSLDEPISVWRSDDAGSNWFLGTSLDIDAGATSPLALADGSVWFLSDENSASTQDAIYRAPPVEAVPTFEKVDSIGVDEWLGFAEFTGLYAHEGDVVVSAYVQRSEDFARQLLTRRFTTEGELVEEHFYDSSAYNRATPERGGFANGIMVIAFEDPDVTHLLHFRSTADFGETFVDTDLDMVADGWLGGPHLPPRIVTLADGRLLLTATVPVGADRYQVAVVDNRSWYR